MEVKVVGCMSGPKSYRCLRLSDVIDRHNKIIHPGDLAHGEAVFVGLEHIEPNTGRRIGSLRINLGDLTGRKPTFKKGQIVYGYLRPYLNKVWLAEFDGCSSVDQFAFDVRPDRADPSFVAAYMRSEVFLRRSSVVTTTGQLPRISIDEILAVEIDLPPLPEQKRIAGILKEQLAAGERARAAAEAQLEAAKALSAAYLRDVFEGDEGSEWPRVPVKELLASPLRTGISKPTDVTSESRCLTLSAVRDGRLKVDESKPAAISDDELKKYSIKAGAFYLVRGNGNRNLVGRSGQAPVTGSAIAFPDLLIEVVPDKGCVLAEFLRFVWDCREVRRDIEQRARTAAGIYKINLRNLSEVLLPIPEIDVQRQAAKQLQQRFQEAASLERSCRDQLAAIESMPAALLRSAFQGQL